MKHIFFSTIPGILLLLITNNTPAQWKDVNTWTTESINIHALAVVISPDGDTSLYAGANYGGMFRSTNDGRTWKDAGGNAPKDLKYVNTLAVIGNTLFAGTDSWSVYYTTDNGINWTSGRAPSYREISTLTVTGTTLITGTKGAGAFRSTDSGKSWINMNPNVKSSASKISSFEKESIQAITAKGSTIFIGTNYVFRSTNNGNNWIEVSSGFGEDQVVQSLLLNGKNLFAGTSKGIYRSTNNGNNWTAINTGLTDVNVYALAANKTQLFAGTKNGVFVSTNNGTSWTEINSGLPDKIPAINALLIYGTDLIAGSERGIWINDQILRSK